MHFLSTPVFVDDVATFDLAGKRLLDMGTGSGQSVSSPPVGAPGHRLRHQPARGRARARQRAPERRRHGVLESDLFSSLGGACSTSSVSICRSTPERSATPFEAAFFGGPAFETISAFAAGCRGALAPGGKVAVIISEDSGHDRIVSLFTGGGFAQIDDRDGGFFSDFTFCSSGRRRRRPSMSVGRR